MLLGSAALALVAAAAFLLLVNAVSTLRTATAHERRAKEITAATLLLEKLVVDLETGLRRTIAWQRERRQLGVAP